MCLCDLWLIAVVVAIILDYFLFAPRRATHLLIRCCFVFILRMPLFAL